MARNGRRDVGRYLPGGDVTLPPVAHAEGNVRAVVAVLRAGVCHFGLPHRCIQAVRLEKGTMDDVG